MELPLYVFWFLKTTPTTAIIKIANDNADYNNMQYLEIISILMRNHKTLFINNFKNYCL